MESQLPEGRRKRDRNLQGPATLFCQRSQTVRGSIQDRVHSLVLAGSTPVVDMPAAFGRRFFWLCFHVETAEKSGAGGTQQRPEHPSENCSQRGLMGWCHRASDSSLAPSGIDTRRVHFVLFGPWGNREGFRPGVRVKRVRFPQGPSRCVVRMVATIRNPGALLAAARVPSTAVHFGEIGCHALGVPTGGAGSSPAGSTFALAAGCCPPSNKGRQRVRSSPEVVPYITLRHCCLANHHSPCHAAAACYCCCCSSSSSHPRDRSGLGAQVASIGSASAAALASSVQLSASPPY
eukprot:COSAG06_NODE_13308_length_1270_cov_0.813834_1_plen_291_part_10